MATLDILQAEADALITMKRLKLMMMSMSIQTWEAL